MNRRSVYSVDLPDDIDDTNLTQQTALELARATYDQYVAATQGYQPSSVELRAKPGEKIELNFTIKELRKKKQKEMATEAT